MKDEHEGYDRVEDDAAVNSKVQSYMVAVLQNPRFFDWAAKRYGNIDIGGVPDLAVGALAIAVAHLERELKDVYTHRDRKFQEVLAARARRSKTHRDRKFQEVLAARARRSKVRF
jgi:hypothetical protein